MDNALTKAKPKLDRSVTGRKRGTPNRVTRLLKDCILLAGEQAGGGGKDGMINYLRTQAIENPGPFLALLGRVLPSTIAADPEGGTIIVEILKRDYRDDLPAPKLIEHK